MRYMHIWFILFCILFLLACIMKNWNWHCVDLTNEVNCAYKFSWPLEFFFIANGHTANYMHTNRLGMLAYQSHIPFEWQLYTYMPTIELSKARFIDAAQDVRANKIFPMFMVATFFCFILAMYMCMCVQMEMGVGLRKMRPMHRSTLQSNSYVYRWFVLWIRKIDKLVLIYCVFLDVVSIYFVISNLIKCVMCVQQVVLCF